MNKEEDFKRFEIETTHERKVILEKDLWIGIRDLLNERQIGALLSIDETEEIYHKLGQMIATYKRTKGETK